MGFWKKRENAEGSAVLPKVDSAKRGAVRAEDSSRALTTQSGTGSAGGFSATAHAIPVSDDQLSRVRSALSEGTSIKGRVSFDSPVRIDGRLQGELYSTRTVFVGEKGTIEASIEVESLVVQGAVRGPVRATARVEVLKGGRVEGEIYAPTLLVEEGGALDGTLVIKGKKA